MIFVEPTKDLKNEFFMTFDLGQTVQISEFQITMNAFLDNYNHNNGQAVLPQMVIIEGKKDSVFLTNQQKSAQGPSNADTDSEFNVNKKGEWQTQDMGDWAQELQLISDNKDKVQAKYSFGHSF